MSNSRFVHDRLRERKRRRRLVALIYALVMTVYLAWRVTIINAGAPTLSIVYFTAEVLGLVLGLTLIFSSWTYRHREPIAAPQGLDVDIFVTCYREPVELVRWTLIAAAGISYPHRTFLLDDGNRTEMRRLADELGVRYLARGENSHAKAGNLNFGLAHSTAEFVMVFDADHIALPHALDVTLGFFRDRNVAMVQTPQDYYNVDAFQYFNARRGGLWHDQSFFYQIAQSCRDAFNGASCVGTSVVYRRSALDRIGGIPTETVTEDIHTSLKLHKAGFEVVYLNESIAYGVAATDLRDYYKTRHRWAHGNIHALRIENVLFCKELTLGQKLSYLTLGIIYLEGWQQLLLFVVPWMSLFFGWAPFEITLFNVLAVMLLPVLTALLLQELGCGLSRYWVNEVFSVARFPVHLVAALALFVGKMPFRTSAKNIRGRIEWRLMAPQLGVGLISLLAAATGVYHLTQHFEIGPLGSAFVSLTEGRFAAVDWSARLDQGYTLELVLVAGFWALFNAGKCFYLIRKAIIDARRSAEDYRFDVRLLMAFPDDAPTSTARVERISRSWIAARFSGGRAPAVGTRLSGALHLPAGPLAVDCIAVRAPAAGLARRLANRLGIIDRKAPDALVECRLEWPDPVDRDRLMRSLYSVEWHREYMRHNAFFNTPMDVLARWLAPATAVPAAGRDWQPAKLGGLDGPATAVVNHSPGSRTARLIAYRAFRPGQIVSVQTFDGPDEISLTLRIIGREPLHTLSPPETGSAAGGPAAMGRAAMGRYVAERLADAGGPAASAQQLIEIPAE